MSNRQLLYTLRQKNALVHAQADFGTAAREEEYTRLSERLGALIETHEQVLEAELVILRKRAIELEEQEQWISTSEKLPELIHRVSTFLYIILGIVITTSCS